MYRYGRCHHRGAEPLQRASDGNSLCRNGSHTPQSSPCRGTMAIVTSPVLVSRSMRPPITSSHRTRRMTSVETSCLKFVLSAASALPSQCSRLYHPSNLANVADAPTLEAGRILPLNTERPCRSAWEQRGMDVPGQPLLTDRLPSEHHGGPSGAVKGCAIFGIAGGLEHRHAHRCEPVI